MFSQTRCTARVGAAPSSARISKRTSLCTDWCLYIYMCVCVNSHIRKACRCRSIFARMSACMTVASNQACICICTYTDVHMHIYNYIRTHPHTRTRAHAHMTARTQSRAGGVGELRSPWDEARGPMPRDPIASCTPDRILDPGLGQLRGSSFGIWIHGLKYG